MNIFSLLSYKKFLAKFINKIKNNKVFMALAYKGHRRNIVLPENFDLEEHLNQYPPEEYGFADSQLRFNKDKIYYFLSLLSTIPARNKDLIDEEGWVPINMSYARNNIKDIKLYKDYLIATGVIECDYHAIKGKKSFGYRWEQQYNRTNFHCCNVACSHEEDAYFMQEENNEELADLPYLSHWYNQKQLTISPYVNQYAHALLIYKLADKSKWSTNSKTGKLKHPQLQYNAVLINIDKIKNHKYEIHVDNTVYRLHTVITNLQKDYRNFLTYNGQELICIDISNSQPYLACALLNPMFWLINSQLPLSLYSLPDNIQKSITSVAIPLNIEKFFRRCNDEDFRDYKKIASDGKMYETIAEECQKNLQKSISRKEAKILMFHLFFSSNQRRNDDITINQMKKIFSNKLFPEVAELFKIIKHKFQDINDEKQHNRLSCLLQAIESEIILHRCCKRIWEEGKQQVPVFTIHDSITTTIEYSEYVKKIMEEELFRAIGVSPTLNIENWNLNKVEYPQILHDIIQ